MSNIEINFKQPPEIASVILGCRKREDCNLEAGEPTRRLLSDVTELEEGLSEGTNFLTIQALTNERVTFAGRCSPDEAGHCALYGRFSGTSSAMAAAQDRGLSQ